MTRAGQRFLSEHPEIAVLIPRLLDRGDPKGREFALLIATLVKTPELLVALRDFALSRRGPDRLRQEAAQAALQAGLIPSGPIRMWLQGKWREVLLFGFELHDEPVRKHMGKVASLSLQAHDALYRGEARTAERLLNEAIRIEPAAPDLQYNLINAYDLQGRTEEAENLLRDLYERDPDYLFARAGLARRHIAGGRLDEAADLLEPLLSRRRLHVSEFAAICMAEIELQLARNEPDGARSWFDLWERAYPDHPMIEPFRRRLRPSLLGRHGPR